MAAALQTVDLSKEARAFIRGDNVKGAVATTTTSTESPASVAEIEAQGVSPAKPAVKTPSLRVVPSLVNLSTRTPSDIHERLMRASFERKLQQLEPHTHQDIIAEALSVWLKKAGYP